MTLDGFVTGAITGVVAISAMKLMKDAIEAKKKNKDKVQTMMNKADRQLKYKESNPFSFKM
jgi:hypothetical protein